MCGGPRTRLQEGGGGAAWQHRQKFPPEMRGGRRAPLRDTTARVRGRKPAPPSLCASPQGRGSEEAPWSPAGLACGAWGRVRLPVVGAPLLPSSQKRRSKFCLTYLFTLTQNRRVPVGHSSSGHCSDWNADSCLPEPSVTSLSTDDSGTDSHSQQQRVQGRKGRSGQVLVMGLRGDRRKSPAQLTAEPATPVSLPACAPDSAAHGLPAPSVRRPCRGARPCSRAPWSPRG